MKEDSTMKKVKLASFEKQIARATVAMYLSKNYSATDLDAARLETEVSRYIGNMDFDHRYEMENFISDCINKELRK